MKHIPLTQGQHAIVDDDLYETLSQWKWLYNSPYATRSAGPRNNREYIIMHRLIMGDPEGFEVDHINGDKLDNRRANLRIATRSQNQQNTPRNRTNRSGFKGVTYDRRKRRYRALIGVNGRQHYLGRFLTAEEAAQVYDEAASRFFGEFAYLNNVRQNGGAQ